MALEDRREARMLEGRAQHSRLSLSDVHLSEAHLRRPSLLHTPSMTMTQWLLFYFQWTLPRAPWAHEAPKQPGDT